MSPASLTLQIITNFFQGELLGRQGKLVSVGESENDLLREKEAARCMFS
ncbi:hypothetical protein wcw_1928 [Waddlia chondrophila WSU 86-1044]|uniref:Uncharacterized protein n=1 Tax=Waddlia chondrophila (strain ATCC VR-1470 / WSU 86-1044) TaxID=716544 RepID=D6YT69_WADCW|nr:hypothetical protein wcw_1928 [Waddlia chondrophila WSU 86-1044]